MYPQICNWSPLTKALLFPLGGGQTALVQPTQRWAAQLLSMKQFTYSGHNNLPWQISTQQSKGNYSQICNWSPLTKALLFPLGGGQTALVQPTQRWAAQLLSILANKTNQTQDHHQIFLWERKFISSIHEIKTKLDETTHHKTGNITSAHTGWEGRENINCILH